ncbi:hypothetical protein GGTG_05436 [Gaeumannomyces tritici R3-111a-1]|uniref:Uncharacterized protein n=1 Tax=Gaeumannomyces tritici (strain R3-111a-1) TaxID=644352 RepID=J3NVX4_GAET3|nr:hypothetical protein GGTG_05436 [Gaeumannomyces tritici R3-111a-1]EJT75503.1 hypothetical protein GGTG_05436 [Gaeumannomyces tritici R3-111a-1]
MQDRRELTYEPEHNVAAKQPIVFDPKRARARFRHEQPAKSWGRDLGLAMWVADVNHPPLGHDGHPYQLPVEPPAGEHGFRHAMPPAKQMRTVEAAPQGPPDGRFWGMVFAADVWDPRCRSEDGSQRMDQWVAGTATAATASQDLAALSRVQSARWAGAVRFPQPPWTPGIIGVMLTHSAPRG